MKRNARYAFNALKKIGAPILDPDRGWGGEFAISAEQAGADNVFYEGSKNDGPDGLPWGDYYGEYQGGYPIVNKAIEEILNKYDLYYEWENAAVFCVYEN